MKKLIPAILAATLAIAPAFADYSEDLHLTEEEWWEKEGFFLGEAFYTQFKPKYGPGDFDKPLIGGGAGLGGEFVNSDLHFGYGGRISLSWLMQDYKGYSADDNIFGFDAHIPVRISNSLTLYGGAGINYHSLSLLMDKGGEIKPVGSGHRTTENVFVGLRWRFLEHAHVFCEYRREFGKVQIGYHTYQYGNDIQRLDIDMACNRIVAGLGVTF